MDQWNRIESPGINSCLYGQLIFDKGGRSIKWSKNSFSTNAAGRYGIVHAKKMKLDHQLTAYPRINSKWIKDLNLSHDTITVEENIGEISDIPCSNIFTDTSSRAKDIKERINKWEYTKLKSFCTAEENIIKM